jgi:hypothetical protein
VSVVVKVNARATPDAAVVQAIVSVEEMMDASARVKMRDVISAAVRHLSRLVRDPIVLNRVMSYAGFMCSKHSRVELLELLALSDVLSMELRKWAREWDCIVGNPQMLRRGPLAVLVAGTARFKVHFQQPMSLPLELLIHSAPSFYGAPHGELFDIPFLKVQDKCFDFFLGTITVCFSVAKDWPCPG